MVIQSESGLKSSKRNCSAIIRSSFFLISLINVITQQPHIPGNECNITKKKIGEKGYEVNCNASRRVPYRNFQSSLVWDFVYIGSLSLRVDYIYQ